MIEIRGNCSVRVFVEYPPFPSERQSRGFPMKSRPLSTMDGGEIVLLRRRRGFATQRELGGSTLKEKIHVHLFAYMHGDFIVSLRRCLLGGSDRVSRPPEEQKGGILPPAHAVRDVLGVTTCLSPWERDGGAREGSLGSPAGGFGRAFVRRFGFPCGISVRAGPPVPFRGRGPGGGPNRGHLRFLSNRVLTDFVLEKL